MSEVEELPELHEVELHEVELHEVGHPVEQGVIGRDDGVPVNAFGDALVPQRPTTLALGLRSYRRAPVASGAGRSGQVPDSVQRRYAASCSSPHFSAAMAWMRSTVAPA